MDYFKYHRYLYALSNRLSRSKFFYALELCASTILGITVIFPLFGILLGINQVLRFCFKLYLWFVYDDEIVLSNDPCGSNYYILSDSQPRSTILYLGEVEGKQDADSLRENYKKHVIENPVYSNLTYTFEKNWPYQCLRKCDTFDIKNHIRYYPGTEERVVAEKELLQEILPKLSEDMHDTEKPLWEEVIIPFYQKSESCTVNTEGTESDTQDTTISLRIIRIHHAYMDGASTLLMIANTMSGEKDSFPFVIDPCKPLKISKLSMFLYKLTCLAIFSTTVIRQMLMPPITRQSRFTVPRNQDGDILFGWTSKIPIQQFQRIKEKTGVSMPAIVTSVLSSAIRKLELEYPVLRENSPAIEVPNEQAVWIVAGMFPYDSKKPGNKHTVIDCQTNTSDISGVERLAMINDDLGRLAKNPLVTVFYWFHKILGTIPLPLQKFFLSLVSCPVLLSNIPLSTRSIKLFGRECYSIVGWVPLLARTGLGVVSVRYGDHFRYCLQADSNVMNQEQLDFFIRQIENQVEELFLETAQLKRRISAESSLFEHGKENQERASEYEKECLITTENEDKKSIASCINNNNLDFVHGLAGTLTSANYSFIFKLKDSIEQIKDGIKKIKEQ